MSETFTCCVRYAVDPSQHEAFKSYARTWVALIEKHGGQHHGYFLPPPPGHAVPNAKKFSFRHLGSEGEANIAVALFSFPNVAAYERYRREVATEPACAEATALAEQSKCFTRYERTFLVPLTGG